MGHQVRPGPRVAGAKAAAKAEAVQRQLPAGWARSSGVGEADHVAAVALEVGLTPKQAMDLLQDHGVISDNCVHVEDIHVGEEADRAIEWLRSLRR